MRSAKKFSINITYTLFPAVYAIFLPLTLSCLASVTTIPNLLKDHKEYNVFFFFHSGFSAFNLLIYSALCLIVLVYVLSGYQLYKSLGRILSMKGLEASLYSLLTGIIWGHFAWGQIQIWDNKSFLVSIMALVYAICHFFLSKDTVSPLIILIPIISYPVWRFFSLWWSTLHQAFSVSSIGASFPESLAYPFYFIFLCLGVSTLSKVFGEVYAYYSFQTSK